MCSGKSCVAPIKCESIPRLELLSCLILARLVDTITRALPFGVAGKMFFSDSTCAISQISSESVLLNFNSHRCSEIQQVTRPEDWRWLPTDENVADLATRGACTVEDVLPGSRYQSGPSWLRLEQDQWPVKTAGEVNHPIPESELNPKMVKLKFMTIQVVDSDFWRKLARRSYRQARWTMQAVLKAANLFKMLLIKKQGVTRKDDTAGNIDGSKFYEDHIFSNTYLVTVCDLFLTSYNQEKELLMDAEGRFDTLQPYYHETEVYWPVVGNDGYYPVRKFRILKMKGRGDKVLEAAAGGKKKLFKDSLGLVLIDRHNKLARLILQQAHDELGHAGHRKTLTHSRRYAWISRGRQKAMKVVKACSQCCLEYARCSGPVMADVLPDRIEPSVPFHNTHVDVAGPIEVTKPRVRTRKNPAKYKVRLLIACCRFTQAVFIDVMMDYSTEAVIIGLRKLQAFYNMPRVITTDQGTNFMG